MKRFALTLAVAVCLSAPGAVPAQANDDNWDFSLLFPMIWAPDINGKIDVDDNVIDVNIPFSDIADSLTMGFLGEFYAQKGRWIYAVKINYLESESESVTDELTLPGFDIPLAPSYSIITDQVTGTTDLMVGYQAHDSVRLYTGVRTLFTEIDLGITPLGPGLIEIEKKINLADETLHDWLVGADFTHQFNPRWGLILSGDVAIAGDNDQDFVTNVALTYRISKLNNLWMGYRYMRIKDKMTEDGVDIKTDFVQQGPMLGWAFTF